MKIQWSDTSVFSKRHGLERCDNGNTQYVMDRLNNRQSSRGGKTPNEI